MTSDRRYKQLRFRQLEMLCEIADTGGVRSAADRLALSPPAVSKALRAIEDSLDFALFQRHARGMRLTPKGERVVAHARLLLNELGTLADQSQVQAAGGGSLQLAASPYVMAHLLPQVLTALRAAEAGGGRTRLQLREGHLAAMVELLRVGEIDALLTLFAHGDLDPARLEGLEIDKLRDEQIVVVAAPGLLGTPRRSRQAWPWRALVDQPWILPPDRLHLRRNIDRMFHLDGVLPPTPVIESTSLGANVRFALSGLGLTVAPRELVADAVARQDLAILTLQQPIPDSAVALVYRGASARYLSAVQRLRQAALEAFAP